MLGPWPDRAVRTRSGSQEQHVEWHKANIFFYSRNRAHIIRQSNSQVHRQVFRTPSVSLGSENNYNAGTLSVNIQDNLANLSICGLSNLTDYKQDACVADQ